VNEGMIVNVFVDDVSAASFVLALTMWAQPAEPVGTLNVVAN